MNQCIAKTHQNLRCKRKSTDNYLLCHQHLELLKNSLKKTDKSIIQNGGQLNLPVLLPSCFDILTCDWITDINYAIPGLASLIQLMSYK